MTEDLHHRLLIPDTNLAAINALLLNPDSRVIDGLLKVVEKYGTPEEINWQAAEARKLPNLMKRLEAVNSPYIADLEWLIEQRDSGAFISEADYRRQVLGPKADAREAQPWRSILRPRANPSAEVAAARLDAATLSRPAEECRVYRCAR